MAIPVRYLTAEGELIAPPFEADSLDQVGAQEPDGIYTVTRTYRSTKAVMLDAHMARLERSAQLEGIKLKLDQAWLRSGLRRIIAQGEYEESRFRITIPRHDPKTALLAVEPLHIVSPEMRSNGVSAATVCIDRPNPKAKSNRWVPQRESARRQLPEWAYEGLVCTDEGIILEGFSSNFYAIIDGRLRTAKGTVLSGIGRMILLTVAEGFIKTEYEPINVSNLSALDEALITSSSRGIVPIVKIDEEIIGDGHPGPLTTGLWQRYQRWVEAHLEEI
jgi:branched-chain amino acid aminotransferase